MKTRIKPSLAAAVAGELRAARSRLNLTLKEAAARCGMHLVSLSRIEQQHRLPSLDVLERIADAYGINVRDLIPADFGEKS